MLKLTYTDAGLHLERLGTSLEVMVAQRVILALRVGYPLQVEPSRASFLLAACTPGLSHLEAALQHDCSAISITPVDAEFVEISLQGSWVAAGSHAHEGMFLAAFSDPIEFVLYSLWTLTQSQVSFLV
ncbi:MAG: hypothetical protein IGS50_09885 [Synechococcales cyanobacterium C42_A2020_086]|jgi:hypothetical protein|nr:hypothetical protein [Synechococcales cyanobacterium M58_A2018_015]MBF2074055.1 hypothetical protein [Synechococcales cyanobacterium C42_A2020_086]